MTHWSTPAAAAISHARRGWAVVPLRPDNGRPMWKWKDLTSTPPGFIASQWPGPRCNPGILTGPSGLVVIDLDDLAAHGTELPPSWARSGVTHGAEVLAILAARAGETIPATYTVTTARNGKHLYFRAPAGQEIRNSTGEQDRGIGPGIDVRAQGGLAVAAGAVRPHGVYQLDDDREPVPLPGWLIKRATVKNAVTTTVKKAVTTQVLAGGYGAGALRSEIADLLTARPGHRNDALNRAAFCLGTLVGTGTLDEATVTAALLEAAGTVGLVADDGQAQCERTIASGLTAGIARPRIRGAA